MIQESFVKVGMADLNVTTDSNGILKTVGLGSCVGLTLYDDERRVAGMVHVMLPSSEIAREGDVNLAKYADTSIPELIRRMTLFGASTHRIVAKMAGGAQMFSFSGLNDSTMRIGPRNVDSCKEMLKKFSIPLLAEDTGGNYGRTIEFYCSTGMLLIRTAQYGNKEV